MSIEDYIAEKKTALTAADIMKMFGVGRNKAYGIIRQIRCECGGGKLGAGKVLPSELEYWANTPDKRKVKRL